MRQHGLPGTAVLLACFVVVLPSVTGIKTHANLSKLLGKTGQAEHGLHLSDAVPPLNVEGVWDLEELRMVEESDVDIMAKAQKETLQQVKQTYIHM